jgi:hypothetical protein
VFLKGAVILGQQPSAPGSPATGQMWVETNGRPYMVDGAGHSTPMTLRSYANPNLFPGETLNTTDPAPSSGDLVYDQSSDRVLRYHSGSGLWIGVNGLIDEKTWMSSMTFTASATNWSDIDSIEVPAGLPTRFVISSTVGLSQGTLAQLALIQVKVRLVDNNATATSFTTKLMDDLLVSYQWASTSAGSLGVRVKADWYIPAQATRLSAKLQAIVTANAGTCSFYNQNNDATSAGGIRTEVAF